MIDSIVKRVSLALIIACVGLSGFVLGQSSAAPPSVPRQSWVYDVPALPVPYFARSLKLRRDGSGILYAALETTDGRGVQVFRQIGDRWHLAYAPGVDAGHYLADFEVLAEHGVLTIVSRDGHARAVGVPLWAPGIR